ncbi:MAG: cytochrome-c oxidase, cbb3-type subunit III [Betaproteobacteria bacterium]|nr:cytochrome-c oxidase, cbb3-type subunit III [Betaproteobacteria bacterium]
MIEGYAVPDFVSDFWHLYIAAATVIGIVAMMWLLKSQTTRKLAAGEDAELMHPTWDGDLQEFNNPLPRWWMFLFWFLLLFGVVYLVLYPGAGKFAGVWNWSSADQYKQEKDRVDAQFNEVLKPFMGKDLMAVSADPVAKEMGQRLFLTYCSQCHGSDGKGSSGFPDLTDGNWLFGGAPDDIKASIANGRVGEMPGGLAGDDKGAKEVANYVLMLGGKPHNAALAEAGKAKYAACAGCHGEDGKGNNAAGFPNLTDASWQYGGSEAAITESIVKGRKGGMPAQMENLGEAKVHLLTAYVWGLGGGAKPVAPAPVVAVEPAADAAAPAPAK